MSETTEIQQLEIVIKNLEMRIDIARNNLAEILIKRDRDDAKDRIVKWTGTLNGQDHPLKSVANYVNHLESQVAILNRIIRNPPWGG